MRFKDRTEAGRMLAKKLERYRSEETVVFALPRGGVVTAVEIAKYFKAPLELVITRKIGHPHNAEYAIAAVAEGGGVVTNPEEIETVDKSWLKKQIEIQKLEISRRRDKYRRNGEVSVDGKTVIIVDDGVATGLTIRAAIMSLKNGNAKKILVAVPVVAQSIAMVLAREAGELIALLIPPDDVFIGAVGAYYNEFPQIADEQVVAILTNYEKRYSSKTQ